MAQEQTVEAARFRIQRLVDEISTLSKKDLRSEEYFQQFLGRAVQAVDGKGGAVWLVAQRGNDGKADFQLAAQVEFESSLFHADEEQHALLLRHISEAAQTRQPNICPPEAPAPEAGSMQAQMAQLQGIAQAPAVAANKTPYPFFQVPLVLKDQVLGVLQVWLQPYVTQQNYGEFVTFLSSIAAHVEQHLQSRRLGSLVLENQRLQHVLKFTNDLAGSLDPLEVSRLSANYGRDLLGCERCSVLTLRGDRWQVMSISGQETVEKKSSLVKAMVAFVGAHARSEVFRKPEPDGRAGANGLRSDLLLLSRKELLDRAGEPQEGVLTNGHGVKEVPSLPLALRTDRIDQQYFELSHVHSAAIAPMFSAEQDLVGVYFAESTGEGFFDNTPGAKEASSSQRLTEWLAIHTGKVLQAAQDYRSLPGLSLARRVRNTANAVTGPRKGRVLIRSAIISAIVLAIAFFPKDDEVDGDCSLQPVVHTAVVPEVPGRLDRVLVREGDRVTKGQVVAEMDKGRLETELESATQERQRSQAEVDRLRGLGDEASAVVAGLQARIAEQLIAKLNTDIASATLRAPIDGVVLTKDLEIHAGEYVQAGAVFAEIAALDRWQLLVEVNEKQIGRVERALSARSPRVVEYILYSQSAQKLRTELLGKQQISAVAYPRETTQVFVLTVPDIIIPDALRNVLRPGLTGRAEVIFGQEPLIWWSAKRVTEWFRLKFIK